MTKKQTTKMNFTLLDGATAINTAIASIQTRGKSLEKDIHIAAVSCLNHADLHGDITLATKLVQAVPNSTRKNALRDWFLAHGKFSYDMKAKGFSYDKTKETQLEVAITTPFWEFKPEPEYIPFDMKAALLQLVAKAEKAVAKGEDVPTESLEALRKLVA